MGDKNGKQPVKSHAPANTTGSSLEDLWVTQPNR